MDLRRNPKEHSEVQDMDDDFTNGHQIDTLSVAERRIEELEVKLSFTEDNIEVLSQRIYQQQLIIDHLIQEIDELRQQALSHIPGETHSLREEIPPHY